MWHNNGMCTLKKAVEHLIHGAQNPTNFFSKDFDQKIAADMTDPDFSDYLGKGYDRAARQVIPIVASFFGPIGAAAGAAYTAANNFGQTGKVGQSLIKGAANYAGSQLGSSVFGDLGNVGNALGDAGPGSLDGIGMGYAGANSVGDSLGQYFGQGTGNAASGALNAVESAPVSNILGSTVANQAASTLTASAPPTIGPSAFVPTQAPASALPGSLSSLSGLDPNQQASNLATKGSYGGGLGSDEQSYFLNLINRQLVDPSIHDSENHVNSLSSLSPIENSYLGNLGLGGYGNSNDLLQAISKWKTPQ